MAYNNWRDEGRGEGREQERITAGIKGQARAKRMDDTTVTVSEHIGQVWRAERSEERHEGQERRGF